MNRRKNMIIPATIKKLENTTMQMNTCTQLDKKDIIHALRQACSYRQKKEKKMHKLRDKLKQTIYRVKLGPKNTHEYRQERKYTCSNKHDNARNHIYTTKTGRNIYNKRNL